MAQQRALVLLLLVLILWAYGCEAARKKRCIYNGKKYNVGAVIVSREDGCIKLRCSKNGKIGLILGKNCVCAKSGISPSSSTAAPSTNAPQPNGGDVKFTFVNRCSKDLWLGASGRSNIRPTFVYHGNEYHTPNNGGWHLPEGNTSEIFVPPDFHAARFWARTGCKGTPNVNFHCETGDCGKYVECAHDNIPRGGVPPATWAEFTLNSHNKDWYDISLVDGFNLPMEIAVETVDQTESHSNEYWCNNPSCSFDINSICPPELSVTGSLGTTVACYSGCSRFKTDEYCCRGAYGHPSTCKPENWTVNYLQEVYEAHCPQAYSYAYDDNTSTFTCRNTNYKIYFC